MRRLFLRNAQPGDLLDDVFVFNNKQIATTTSGKYYIKAFLGDKTSQVTARKWDASQELFKALPDSGFVHIRGRVENYQGNLQIIMDFLAPPKEGTYAVEDLLASTKKDVKVMFARLVELCGSISNRHLKAIVQAFVDDEELMANLRRSPAAMTFHHAFIGGLLEHTLNAMEVVNAVAPFYKGLNRDLVLAGVFLHDLAKTWELKYETAFSYTDGGQLVGHIVKIALWLEDKAKIAAAKLGEPIPRELIDVLQHIVLSHHGEPEFGAAKVPATPEAIAVHEIENFDAKMTMALTATRDEDAKGDGNWTEFMKAFGVKMYRPDVAPPEPEKVDANEVKLTNPLFGDFVKK